MASHIKVLGSRFKSSAQGSRSLQLGQFLLIFYGFAWIALALGLRTA